jgi:large subunit ribosomal protein L21
MKYAIIRSGNKQYRCVEGAALEVDLLPVEDGADYVIEDVLLVANDSEVTIGTPRVEGAKVNTTVVGMVKGPKLIAFRYKAKERQRRKRGHRQRFTRLQITSIEG